MASPSTDFIVLDGIPRATVANALQVQARADYLNALTRMREAFKDANAKVLAMRDGGGCRDVIASARLAINAACDEFGEAISAAERLFQAGVDLQGEEPEPP